ncbi:tetratricopeptide repeat protein [Halomonas koreensis]|uniref:Tetratricopeptide repeat protein n=1 Tax=Halomonas koreensis TaxID=245385 RepID=A0ABU1G6J8_9GAMM|nr:tetratricopeptide repeat protein [Halomonas koreensis]MDR5868539.1 tetratricopeptide repeat protein [Halomonas koreensis]
MPIVDPRTGEPLTSEPQAEAASGAAQGQGAQRDDLILDVDRNNIQQLLETSMQVPVLLDCWAPWCEPCKNLMPVLEKLTREYNGAFLLAKLNIDDNPDIAGQLGVRSVPDVKLISQGGLVDQFQGALPEKQIREWLGKYFPEPEGAQLSPEEEAAAALEAGDAATARRIYEELVQQWPDHAPYRVALARALVADGEPEQAKAMLEALPPEERDAAAARGVRASIEFGEEAPSAEALAALEGRDDSEARYQRALRQVADGQYEAGIEALLALMQADRAYGDDAARKTLLRVFDALGADHPLTVTYRRKLFALLY